MEFKGRFRQKYTINRKVDEVVVNVILLEHEGVIGTSKNIYYGLATVNGKDYQHEKLATCVNAKLMAENIGKEVLNDLKVKARKEGKTFRIKRK